MSQPWAGKSVGGHPTGQAIPAQLVGAPSRSVAPQGATSVLAGGVDWVDEEPRCLGVIKKNGWPCDQSPRANSRHCFGHRDYEG